MLSGRLPFDGNDWAELYGAILNEEPDPLPGAVPGWLRQVVAKALIKDLERRYQSAQEMRQALLQFDRDRQAEIAERGRREAERRRLEGEERKRQEEEARQREVERRRRIEEDARLKAPQEETTRKEEELAKLKQSLPDEAVTERIVRRTDKDATTLFARQPDETATEPIVRRPGAVERRIDPETDRKRLNDGRRWKGSRQVLIAGAALAVVIVVAYLIARQITPEQQSQNTPSSSQRTSSFETVMRVRLSAPIEDLWLKVKTDDDDAEQMILRLGESREFDVSEKIVLSIGRVQSLRVAVNGRNMDFVRLLPNPKAVVATDVVITKNNYQQYLE
jgi:hypothetical protein